MNAAIFHCVRVCVCVVAHIYISLVVVQKFIVFVVVVIVVVVGNQQEVFVVCEVSKRQLGCN